MRCFHPGMIVWQCLCAAEILLCEVRGKTWKKRRTPPLGIEPRTCRLTADRSANGALEAWINSFCWHLTTTWKKKKKITSHFSQKDWLVRFFFFSSESFFFFLTRPEHCWPFISSSYQASLPNVRCSLPKFDSKILITSNALQRDSNMQTPRTPTYGAFFQWFLFRMDFAQIWSYSERSTRADYRSRFKIKKSEKKAVAFSFRIVKRGLNLMRSMQQGISTHYNTRFGI